MSELKDLVGLHMLDAVDFETVARQEYEGSEDLIDSQTCRFRLDGTLWAAIEDPSDGYRSSMKELIKEPGAKVVNEFVPVQIMAVWRDWSQNYGKADLLDLIDVVTGKTVLRIGTDNIDDYYPGFVSEFDPTAMSSNREIGNV